MLNVVSLKEAYKITIDNFQSFCLNHELVELKNLNNRFLNSDLYSNEDIPNYNRSSVDGYAVISSNLIGASNTVPVQLKLVGEIKIGIKKNMKIKNGECIYIPTGGELPDGADTVVMIEYTEDYNAEFIYFNKGFAVGSNIIFKGDDFKRGEILFYEGQKINSRDISALAALGFYEIPVKKRIRVAIISTGDELIDIDKECEYPKLRDINSYMLFSELQQYGAEPVMFGITPDDNKQIYKKIELALQDCDMILITGGSSAGKKDLTIDVINSFKNSKILFHGIAIKPGKPTILSTIGNKPVVGLPGHPGSCYFIYKTLITQLLNVINHNNRKKNFFIRAKIETNYPSNNGREEFVAVTLQEIDGQYFAKPIFTKSGLVSILSIADGYFIIPDNCEGIKKGNEVEVILF